MEPQASRSGEEWVLTFHGIGSTRRPLAPGEDSVWLKAGAFEEMLDALRPAPNLRLSFDDGNASDCEIALPALAQRGLRGSFFLCAGLLGRPGYLTGRQVRELADAGMPLGSHGFHHRPWPGLSPAELDLELRQARERLEDAAGCAIREAACPLGAYDRRVLRRLREAGYDRVYTSDGGPAREGAWLQPRTTVLRSHTAADLVELLGERPSMARRIGRQLRLTLKRWR